MGEVTSSKIQKSSWKKLQADEQSRVFKFGEGGHIIKVENWILWRTADNNTARGLTRKTRYARKPQAWGERPSTRREHRCGLEQHL